MQLFYTQEVKSDFALMVGEEAKHAAKVLRAKIGHQIHFTNGEGKFFIGEISKIDKELIEIINVKCVREELIKNKIHFYVGILKNPDRFEWMVEKLCELGINEITPLIGDRSVKKNMNQKRLQNIAVSAMKQSLRISISVIHNPVNIYQLSFTANENYYFGCCNEMEKIKLNDILFSEKKNHFFIGPEGDFSDKEIEFLTKNGAKAVDFGNMRLRTETASIFAASVLISHT